MVFFVKKVFARRPGLVVIAKNIGWLFFDKILRMGVGLLVGVWVARYLGPEQYGLLSYAGALVALFGGVAGLGLQGVVVRDLVHNPEKAGEILGTAAIMQFLGGLCAYGLIIGYIYWARPDDLQAKAIVVVLGSMMIFKVNEIATYWFEAQVLSKYVVWAQNISFVFFAAVKVVLVLNNKPLMAFAWASAAEALVTAMFIVSMLGFRGIQLSKLKIVYKLARRLLMDSWPLLLSGVAIMIYMRIDLIMLGQMVGDRAVGIYDVAVRISEVWYFIPMVIVSSVFPAILEAKKTNESKYHKRMQQLYDLMVLLSVVVALPMTFLARPLVTLMFGEDFAEAGPVLAVHIWAAVFVFLGVASSRWFLAENRQILSFQRSLFGAFINILLNLFMIPELGALGAAIATVVSYLSSAFLFDLFQRETRPMFFMKCRSVNLAAAFSRLRRDKVVS